MSIGKYCKTLSLGNMSNPLINRWGSNLIWYHFWYADKTYGKQVQQDRIFSKLLEMYLTYGIETHYNHFTSIYWYKKIKKNIPVTSYYRHVTITRPLIRITTTFRLRKSMIDYYRMRIWILRYSNWLIINMYWFHPNKNKKMVQKVIQKNIEHDFISTRNNLKPTSYRRLMGLYNLTNVYQLNKWGEQSFYTF